MLRILLPLLIALLAAGGAPLPVPSAALIRDFAGMSIDVPAAGDPIVQLLPAREREFGIIAAMEVRASPQRLVALVRRLEHLQQGDCLIAVGQFSDPPVREDLAAVRLPPGDLEDLRDCRPGRCDVKLSDDEIAAVQHAIRGAGDSWPAAAEAAMKTVMLDRLRAFRERGHAGLREYHDKRTPVRLDAEFSALLSTMTFVGRDTTAVVDYLLRRPDARLRPATEFYYWSVDALGLKPVTSVTRVSIFAPTGGGEVLVVSTQVFATHYLTASLSMMTIVNGVANGPGVFIYANRSRSDGLQGLFGGLVRRKVEARVRAAAPGALATLRLRLEANPAQRRP